MNIRLNKQDKKIKIVFRTDKISLKKSMDKVQLDHTGKRGPQGPQGEQGEKGDKGDTGDTGVSTMVRVVHGTDPDVARPSALYVEWVGSVAPNNATPDDTWIDTE
jgi:hypothetical protein